MYVCMYVCKKFKNTSKKYSSHHSDSQSYNINWKRDFGGNVLLQTQQTILAIMTQISHIHLDNSVIYLL